MATKKPQFQANGQSAETKQPKKKEKKREGSLKLKNKCSTHPYSGPSLPMADTMITLLAVSSQTCRARRNFYVDLAKFWCATNTVSLTEATAQVNRVTEIC